eukprot:SAG31_NODE_7777_length_1599_cov_1.472667_3_plen_163_part_00
MSAHTYPTASVGDVKFAYTCRCDCSAACMVATVRQLTDHANSFAAAARLGGGSFTQLLGSHLFLEAVCCHHRDVWRQRRRLVLPGSSFGRASRNVRGPLPEKVRSNAPCSEAQRFERIRLVRSRDPPSQLGSHQQQCAAFEKRTVWPLRCGAAIASTWPRQQ